MNLVPLFEEALEFQNYNGTVLSNGKAAVYYIGRTRLADIYNDVAAEYPAENPRILDNLGMGPIYVNPAFDYELVVFDAYDNELFSVKKYLHSKGEHSTANVVVTPSENIAVSAWTVGDVQVYMPYLTGDVGKTYEGVDPIVVNNVEDKISANHVPLGVQEPLYFVQDDEEGCIIGYSGNDQPYVNHDRTIKIDNHVISTDMQSVMVRQQINNSSTDYKYAKICEADLNTITWINEWMTTLQLNFQSCGAYYEGKSFGTFVLNCENYVQSSQTYVQKHEEDGKWVIFAKDNHSPQIVKLYLYWRDDSSSQHYELWGEFANVKYYEAVGVAAVLNCSLRNHLTSSLPIEQERNIWRFNSIGVETLKNALPTGMNLVGQYLPEDASIKPVSDDSAGTFYATYTYGGPDSGNTSYEDIKAAYDAGKAIFVKFKESANAQETEIFSLVGFWEVNNRPDLNRFQFQNLDQWSGKTIYRFPSNWGKMSDHDFAEKDDLWTLTQSIAPDDFLVPIPSPSGVYCTRNYQVYKALEPITSNTWVDSAWSAVNVGDILYDLENRENDPGVFFATYPSTDPSAVQQAITDGKEVILKLGTNYIPLVQSNTGDALFCGLVTGNSGGAGGYSVGLDFSTGWGEPESIPFATYPGVQGMISAATSGKMDTSASGDFYPMTGNPSGFLTEHQSLSESGNWNSTYNTVNTNSGNWNSTYNTVNTNSGSWTAHPQIPISGINIDIYESDGKVVFSGMSGGGTDLDFGWHDTAISSINGSGLYDTSAHARITTLSNNKLNTTAFSTVSGSFLTAVPSDMATTGDIAELAETVSETYQPKGDYYSASNPSGFITGVDLTPYQEKADMTAYQAAGDYMTADALTGVSGTWNTVTDKLDSTAFSTVSGSFLTAHQELPESANWNSTYNTVSDNSASWGSEYGWHDDAISSINGSALYDTSAHARITTLSNNKLNTTAFSTVSGSFLTAHQELPESANWNAAYTEVSTNSADWNSAAGMNELPVSAGEGIDIQNVDGNIVFSCTGGSVPEGVLVESGLEYNAVNEISGYSGSAFAQYGANKQWLQHDDTLLHVANSAQYALGVNVSAVAQLLGTDETVLWENTTSGVYNDTITLNEPWSGFDKIRIEVTDAFGFGGKCEQFDTLNLAGNRVKNFGCSYPFVLTGSPNKQYIRGCDLSFVNNEFISGTVISFETTLTPNTTIACTTGGSGPRLIRVVGIGRKEV